MTTPLEKLDKKSRASSAIQPSSAVEEKEPLSTPVASDAVSSSSESSSAEEKKPSNYAMMPQMPTQEGPEGILFDFNMGLRVKFPEKGSDYNVAFTDIDTGNILFASPVKAGSYVVSTKKYYVNFRLAIYHTDEKEPFFTHDYKAKGKTVVVQIPGDTLGDTIGWFSYAERFQEKHQCELYVVMKPQFIELFQKHYPKLHLVTKEEAEKLQPYACYYIGLFWHDDDTNQKRDHRLVGNHATAGWILGVDPSDIPPRCDLSAPRKLKERYVVIATQASAQCKYWNNPFGWREVIQFLHEKGYKVVCCDRNPTSGQGMVWNQMPWGVDIDETGDKPLQERIDLIKDADAFIGYSSGLCWVAWMCHVPTVIISGFSAPHTEFATPYRVINYDVCNSCWNDLRCDFNHSDFLWCPRHKGTDRQFECSRNISAKMVIDTIQRIPAFHSQPQNTQKTQK